jgi:hypothetical protein
MAAYDWLHVVLCLFLLLWTAPAEAQTDPTPIVGGGVLISIENGRDDPPYLGGPLSGGGPAWDVMAGAKVSPRTAIVFEVGDARGYTVQQAVRIGGGSDRYERTHHDTMYALMLHFRLVEQFNVVGGFALVHRHTDEIRRRFHNPIGSMPGSVEGPFTSNHNGVSGGAVLGIDWAAFQRNVVGVGPTARVFIVNHGDVGSPPQYGYGAFVVRIGLHVLARF